MIEQFPFGKNKIVVFEAGAELVECLVQAEQEAPADIAIWSDDIQQYRINFANNKTPAGLKGVYGSTQLAIRAIHAHAWSVKGHRARPGKAVKAQ